MQVNVSPSYIPPVGTLINFDHNPNMLLGRVSKVVKTDDGKTANVFIEPIQKECNDDYPMPLASRMNPRFYQKIKISKETKTANKPFCKRCHRKDCACK